MLAVAVDELDAHLEAEVDDARDHGLEGAPGVGSSESARSCGRTGPAAVWTTGPKNDITKSFAGARRARAGRRSAGCAPRSSARSRSATSIASSWSWVTMTVVDVRLVVEAAEPAAAARCGPGRRARRTARREAGRSARPRARGRAPSAAAGRRRAAPGSGRRSPWSWTRRSSSLTRSVTSAFGRRRISSPKATFLRTVMCLNAA